MSDGQQVGLSGITQRTPDREQLVSDWVSGIGDVTTGVTTRVRISVFSRVFPSGVESCRVYCEGVSSPLGTAFPRVVSFLEVPRGPLPSPTVTTASRWAAVVGGLHLCGHSGVAEACVE